MKQEVTFVLSSESIINQILAMSALRAAMSKGEKIPAVLSSDRKPSLRQMIQNAFADFVLEILPFVGDSSINDREAIAEDDEGFLMEELRLSFDLAISEDMGGTMCGSIRKLTEHIVGMKTLEYVYSGDDDVMSERFGEMAGESLVRLKKILGNEPVPTKFKMCWL